MLRRTFLQTSSAAALAAAANAPGEGIRLGFDTFSIRDFHWKDIQYLDYAASLKLDTVQLSSLNDYESLDPEHLAKVKDHAERVGVIIDAGIGCICNVAKSWNAKEENPTAYLRKGLRVAKAVGAHAMRCNLGTREDRPNLDRCVEATVKALQSVRTEALDLGVRIAVENHAGDMQAREVKALIEAAGKDFVGSCLDSGNPVWAIEDPLLTLEILGPYVVTTHIRDSAVFEHPRGAAVQWVALGGFPVLCRPLPEALSARLHAARNHNRHPAGGGAVSRTGLLESVSAYAGLGIRALPEAGQERPSLYRADGNRGLGK